MLTNQRNWTLCFDEAGFWLEPGSGSWLQDGHRVIEKGLETILFHWANELLVAPRLQMLGCSGAATREQDLLAVDDLGRIHIFELKKDRGDAKALFQLVSYLTGRPRDDERWVREMVTHTLWHGEQAAACRLAGLVARRLDETVRTSKSRRVAGHAVPHRELLKARLDVLTDLAEERTGLNLTPGAFREIARSLLEEEFGGRWTGPSESPAGVLDQVAKARLPTHWELGRTKPGIVIWMVAPNIGGALTAAQPLIERGLEIRCVSVDVREVVPGREWRIAVAEPVDHVEGWTRADSIARLLVKIANAHLEACPEAAARLYLGLEPESFCGQSGSGWAELGWRAAGGASVFFAVGDRLIEPDLYNHNWTQGQLPPLRSPILRLCRELRKQHPASWPWSAHDPENEDNQRFVDGAVALANAFYRGLAEIGAFDMDLWGYWMPPDASMGQ